MNNAQLLLISITALVSIFLAIMWIRYLTAFRDRDAGRVSSVVSLSTASATTLAYAFFLVCWIHTPPIDIPEHWKFFRYAVFFGLPLSAISLFLAFFVRQSMEKIGLLLTSLVIGLLWFLAAGVALPKS
jgi:hypothetical protein